MRLRRYVQFRPVPWCVCATFISFASLQELTYPIIGVNWRKRAQIWRFELFSGGLNIWKNESGKEMHWFAPGWSILHFAIVKKKPSFLQAQLIDNLILKPRLHDCKPYICPQKAVFYCRLNSFSAPFCVNLHLPGFRFPTNRSALRNSRCRWQTFSTLQGTSKQRNDLFSYSLMIAYLNSM